MTLSFETTPEQDAALVAYHAYNAPEIPFEEWMAGQMSAIVSRTVEWFNEQRLRAIKDAYMNGTPLQRAQTDRIFDIDIVANRNA